MDLDSRRSHLTAYMEGGFVVFLIGMRINRWWRPDQWLPVSLAMPRMLRELEANPASGFLGAESGAGNPSIMVQYWRSSDHLVEYARSKDARHFPAWVDFNRRIARTDAVGIWHETYVIAPGRYEALYVHMPPFGLGRVAGVVPAEGKLATAKGRIAAGREPPSAP